MPVTRAQVLASVRRWRRRLHLEAWTIRVTCRQLLPDCRADCDAQPEYRSATLRFSLRAIERADLDAYVCHELLHCHAWALGAAALAAAGSGRAARELVRREEEQLVEGLTTILCRAYGHRAGEVVAK